MGTNGAVQLLERISKMQRILIFYVVAFLISFLTFPLTLNKSLENSFYIGTISCNYTEEGRRDAFHQRNQDALDGF